MNAVTEILEMHAMYHREQVAMLVLIKWKINSYADNILKKGEDATEERQIVTRYQSRINSHRALIAWISQLQAAITLSPVCGACGKHTENIQPGSLDYVRLCSECAE